MFSSSFRQHILKALLGVALVAGSFSFVAPAKAVAQARVVPVYVLSPQGQQTLRYILTGLPPYVQGLVLNAFQSLPPAQAEAELAQVRSMSPEYLQRVGQGFLFALQVLPPAYHQAFVDGMFDVSPAESQFTAQVFEQIARNTGSGRGGIGPSDDVIKEMIRIKREIDDGYIRSLGASAQ
jgi:hypothetical protein